MNGLSFLFSFNLFFFSFFTPSTLQTCSLFGEDYREAALVSSKEEAAAGGAEWGQCALWGLAEVQLLAGGNGMVWAQPGVGVASHWLLSPCRIVTGTRVMI